MVRKILLSGLLIAPMLLLMGFKFVFPWDNKQERNIVPVKAEIHQQEGITVYYFYAKPRCISCQKIENYTQEAVTSLSNSNVVYKAVNLDLPENKHYYKDYGLYTKAVVLSQVHEGKEIKSKNLTKIWTKLNDEKAFKEYINKEITQFPGE